MGREINLNVGIREAHLFGDNAAALVQFLRCKAGVGRVYQQRLLKSFGYLWASCPGFTVYYHWVRGTANPADRIGKLHDQFGWNLALAREAATRRVGNLWAFPDRKTDFLWTLGVPMGPFAPSLGSQASDGMLSRLGRNFMRLSCSTGSMGVMT